MHIERQQAFHFRQIETKRWKSLTKESTVNLVRRIVEDSNRLALRVLLDTRRLFSFKDGPPLLLPEFLLILRDRIASPEEDYDIEDAKFADCTYDLTLAKYANLPEPSNKKSNTENYSFIGAKANCKNYYRAFLRIMQQRMDQEKIRSQSQEESYAGIELQKMVYRNFWWSKHECKRKTPFSKRYTWKINGLGFTLWRPSYMTAKEFREWLKENVSDIDLDAPDAQKQIQSLIDANLKRGYHVSMDVPGIAGSLGMAEQVTSIEFKEGIDFVFNLAKAVAQEKIENIHELRPAIKKLGEKNIQELILQVFKNLAKGGYQASETTKQYGISKATLSRFAGNKWFEKKGDVETVVIPDLWRNTARVLAGNPVFMETVITSGFVGNLESILSSLENNRGE